MNTGITKGIFINMIKPFIERNSYPFHKRYQLHKNILVNYVWRTCINIGLPRDPTDRISF